MSFRSLMLVTALAACCGGLVTTASAGVEVAGADPARLEVVFDLEGLALQQDSVGGTTVTNISLPGALPRQEAGFPELPTLAVTLAIPAEGSPRLEIVAHRERALATAPPRPSLGHVDRNTDPAHLVPEFGPAYTAAGAHPASAAELTRPFLRGDRRGVVLRLNPVRWDPVGQQLLVTDRLVVRVVTEGTGGVNALPADAPRASAAFVRSLDGVFANDNDVVPTIDKTGAVAPRARMLVVAHDDFLPALDPFLTWKARRGIPATVLPMSATGGSATALREMIKDDYNTTPGLTWVLLVGDREQVPPTVGSYDGSDADTPYGMLLGDDLHAEVHVSRVSVRTLEEARVQLNKFVAYESNPSTGADAAWYARGAGIASDEGVPADYERAELLRTDLLNDDFTVVDRIYQGLGASTGSIAAAVNEGRSLLNYLGHGSGTSWDSVPFGVAEVAALANGPRLPWIIDVACSNGEFARATCFAEAWLRAGTASEPAGAVGMIAASSLAPWTPPTVMQAEVVDLLTAGETFTFGSLLYRGLGRVADEYAGVPVAVQVVEQNIVFGDASLQVRTRAPDHFVVNAPYAAYALEPILAVAVGLPAAGTVAVTAGSTLLGAADFTSAGLVQVPVSGLAAHDEIVVTVTGANMVPWSTVLPVAAGATPVPDAVVAGPELRGNWPNPFNPATSIGFSLPAAADVRLTVYDLAGRAVIRLVDGALPAGDHAVRWNGRDSAGRAAPSGVYLYRLESPLGQRQGRMVLAK